MKDPSGVRNTALPLRSTTDLEPLLERIGNARYVLLGEASHGSHEFYAGRSALTRRLIEEHGFSFVVVEGDWPDCWDVRRSVTAARGHRRTRPGIPVSRTGPHHWNHCKKGELHENYRHL